MQSGRGSALQCTRALLKGGTLSVAYRGVWAPLGGVAGLNAIVFGAYGNTRRALPNPDSLATHAVAGSVAGLLQGFVCAPVELIKTRQQLAVPGDGIPSGAWAGARHIMRTGGFKALFRGLGVTLVRDSPAFAIYFSTYEAMTRGDQSAARVFVAGGFAGAMSWVLLYPIDVVKSRVQGDIIGKYSGAWDCFFRSIRTEGWACMSRGLGTVVLRAFISNGMCFTAVVWTERVWQKFTSDGAYRQFVQAAVCSSDIPDRYFDVKG